jgi:hypothetical protein
VVWTAVKNLPSGMPKIANKDAMAGVDVRIIGHPSAGGWSVWAGNVQNENGSDVLRFTTTRNASLADGYSAAPSLIRKAGSWECTVEPMQATESK